MKIQLVASAFLIFSSCASQTVIPFDKKPVASENSMPEKSADTFSENESKSEVSKSQAVQSSSRDYVSADPYAKFNEALKQQNNEAIQKEAAEVLTQNPKDLKAINALAIVYYKKNRYQAAAYLLNKAIELNPNSSTSYSNMGLVHLAQNEKREAIKSFRKAIEVNPQDSFAAVNLGSIYLREKDYNKANLALEIAVKNGMSDFKTLNNYAVSLAAVKKTKEAADLYEKLLKENPSQKDVMLNYSILMIDEMQKYREGLDLLNRLKFVGSTAESRQIIKELENKAKAGLK